MNYRMRRSLYFVEKRNSYYNDYTVLDDWRLNAYINTLFYARAKEQYNNDVTGNYGEFYCWMCENTADGVLVIRLATIKRMVGYHFYNSKENVVIFRATSIEYHPVKTSEYSIVTDQSILCKPICLLCSGLHSTEPDKFDPLAMKVGEEKYFTYSVKYYHKRYGPFIVNPD